MQILIIVLVAAIALAAVLYPLLRPSARDVAVAPAGLDAATLDAELERYRAALRSGTLCLSCGAPNPKGSRFCAQCGDRLIAASAVPLDAE